MKQKFIYALIMMALLLCTSAHAIAQEFSFSDLQKLIQDKKPNSVESVLRLLPKDYLTNYTLVFESRSLQQSTVKNPRAIVFGNDGRLIITFNGDPTLPGYDSVETMQFNQETLEMEFRHIQFKNKTALISEKNPQLCMSCHGELGHPIWGSYSAWPGVYGTNDDTIFNNDEGDNFRSFLKGMKKHSRYRYLNQRPEISNVWPYREDGSKHISRPNDRVGNFLGNLWGQSVSRRIINSNFYKAHPASTLLWLNSLGLGNCESKNIAARINAWFEIRFPKNEYAYLYQQLESIPEYYVFPFVTKLNLVATVQMEKLILDSDHLTWDLKIDALPPSVHFSSGVAILEELAAGRVFQNAAAQNEKLNGLFGQTTLENWFDFGYSPGYFNKVAAPYGVAKNYESTGFFQDYEKSNLACDLLEAESRDEH